MAVDSVQKIALDEPVVVDATIRRNGSAGWNFYISKDHLPMSGRTVGIFEIDGIPMALNCIKDNTFYVPKYLREIVPAEVDDTIPVKVIGAVTRNTLEPVSSEDNVKNSNGGDS